MKIKRALTPTDLLNKKYKTLKLSPEWYDAFEEPETTGVWFIWGHSGNGKTAFLMQLCKELSRHGKVIFNSLEEGSAKTMQNAVRQHGVAASKKGHVLFTKESMEDLSIRLEKPRSPDFAIIDSWQYTFFTKKEYLAYKERHHNKLLIFISQAEGKHPEGKVAKSVKYDADLKIWIEGFVAFSQGRYRGPKAQYTIYEEGARQYHGNVIINTNTQ